MSSQPPHLLKYASALFLAFCLPVPAWAGSYQEARGVYLSGDVTRAETMFKAIVADPVVAIGERANASRELARIAWLVDGNGPKAVRILTRSLVDDPDPCPAALLLGRVLNDGLRPDLAPTRLAPWQERCAAIERGVALQITRGHILSAASKPPHARAGAVEAARASWRQMDLTARSSLAGSRQRMRIGLLAGDGNEALAGWRDYFWLGSASAPQALDFSDADVVTAFRSGGRHGAGKAEALSLAQVLVRAGFAEEARQLSSDRKLASSGGSLAARWDLIRRYLALRDGLVAAALAHDRAYARTRLDDGTRYRTEVERVVREAIAGIAPSDAAPMDVLRDTWGLFGTPVGETGGVMSQHLGHVIDDEQREVVQGERRGRIRFINLDNMIVNSFSGWLPDGEHAPSGWATGGDTIIQIRPLYADGVLSRLGIALPGPARDRFIQSIEQGEAEDRRSYAAGKLVELTGMSRRLRLQAVDLLAAELRLQPGPEPFEQRFRRTWYERELHCSITLHEGRHVLDQAQFIGATALEGAELEYRAKLSALSLCPSPRIVINTIIGLGEGPHGIANRRIWTAFTQWIAAHRSEVAGHDPTVPDHAQVHRLTDDQLRTVASGLDREVSAGPPPSRQGNRLAASAGPLFPAPIGVSAGVDAYGWTGHRTPQGMAGVTDTALRSGWEQTLTPAGRDFVRDLALTGLVCAFPF